MSKIITKEIDLDGRKLTLETGKLANLTDASVVATWGETVVLVTVATQPTQEPLNYFPLSVEYVEKYYAGGRITAQKFIKREARPSEDSILSGRAIDRAIRPLFLQDFSHEVQVMVTVLSFDGENDPATLGLIGASAALSISSIPWKGPLGTTKLGEADGKFIFNPTLAEVEHLSVDLTVVSTKDKVVMIEAEGKQVPDELIVDAIKLAHEHNQLIIKLINEFTKEAGKIKGQYTPVFETIDENLLTEVKRVAKEKIESALFDADTPWHEATGATIKKELVTAYAQQLTHLQIEAIFDKLAKEIMNDTVLNKGKRVDGRAMDEVRRIEIETGILPRTHGSAIFKRGDTQILSVVTLGPLSASQTLESMAGESHKRFMHHYNMSINPFSTGEVKRIAAPNRRDIGHGNLVERSLVNVLPSEDDFPYAIRVVSEVLSANASTSMASVCSSSLALLNAGVKIEPVAGVAMGLFSPLRIPHLSIGEDEASKKRSQTNDKKLRPSRQLAGVEDSLSADKGFQLITDMRAVEDFYGEMDFKVSGTKRGITAIQMDTKLEGLGFDIIEQALTMAKAARSKILDQINQVAPKADEISQYAPKIEVIHIKPEEIGLLIGTGGKNINSIIARTGAQIDIEDDGTVMVSSTDEQAIKKAVEAISGMFASVEVGQTFDGKVVKLVSFGAFVEIMPGKEGLVHVSQMAPYRVERPEDITQVGQIVHTRVTEVSPDGKIALSMLFGEDQRKVSERRPRTEFGAQRFSNKRGGPARPAGGFDRSRYGGRGGRFGR